MTIIRFEGTPPPTPGEVADELACQIVRTFTGVARVLGDDLGRPDWTAQQLTDELLRRLHRRVHDVVAVYGPEDVEHAAFLLAEAVDHLGAGEILDPDAVARLWHRLTEE